MCGRPGPALAGGFGLALACDLILASDKARFGFTEVKIGFVPAIVLNFALRKLRESDVRRLLLTGKIIDAAEAVRIGLISEIIDDNEIDAFTEDFLNEFISSTSGNAVALTKDILSDVRDMTLEEALRYSAMMNAAARSTEDFKKGVDGFVNKKQVEWK